MAENVKVCLPAAQPCQDFTLTRGEAESIDSLPRRRMPPSSTRKAISFYTLPAGKWTAEADRLSRRESRKEMVAAGYALRGPRRVGFEVAQYDRARPLIIDPTLSYAS